jgi:hypothetical protein
MIVCHVSGEWLGSCFQLLKVFSDWADALRCKQHFTFLTTVHVRNANNFMYLSCAFSEGGTLIHTYWLRCNNHPVHGKQFWPFFYTLNIQNAKPNIPPIPQCYVFVNCITSASHTFWFGPQIWIVSYWQELIQRGGAAQCVQCQKTQYLRLIGNSLCTDVHNAM